MDQGLRNRRTAFLIGLAVSAVAVALSLITAPDPASASEPNTLTLVLLAYGLGGIAVWWYFLRPERVVEMADRQEPRPTIGRMAWLLSLMGNAAMLGPVVCGVLLYQISGEPWRLALLGGIGLIAGAVLYVRVGQDLRVLKEHGLEAWDPFGPPMD